MIEEIDHEEIVEPIKPSHELYHECQEIIEWCEHYDEQEKKNKELFKNLGRKK